MIDLLVPVIPMDITPVIPMDILGSMKETIDDAKVVILAAVGLISMMIVLGVAWATKGAMGAIIKVGVSCAIVFALCAGLIVYLGNSVTDEVKTRTKESGDILLRSPVVIPHNDSGVSHG